MDDILLYFSLLHEGDWERIYSSIKNLEKIDEEIFIKLKKDLKSSYVTILSPNYPDRLRHISHPPFVLYYYGNYELLIKQTSIAVIGTRQPSDYGLRVTEKLVRELVKKDYLIISGIAYGIDGKAHKVALDVQSGSTIAVLPCGIDSCYPKEHQPLKWEIANRGLVVSEYPATTNVKKISFRNRNRIVAGLADSVLVIEAGERSGTSITVSHALEYGKDIFAVPARIDELNGTNKLIKQGACLVESVQDIFDYFS